MEIIDKGYAVIYIEEDINCLKHKTLMTDSIMKSIQSGIIGSRKKNIYVIYPEEKLLPSYPNKDFNDITNNHSTSRKFVIPEKHIKAFINIYFPDFNKGQTGKLFIIQENTYEKSLKKAKFLQETEKEAKIISSYFRDMRELDGLYKIDLLRANLIKNPNLSIIYHTHLNIEYSLLQVKLDFLEPIIFH